MKKVILMAGLMAAVLTACDKDDDNGSNLNATDEMFLTQVSMGNNAEIMAGGLAASKANAASVKSFGSLMVSEHTTAQIDLENLADDLNRNLPDTVDAEHQALMQRLNSLSAAMFDTAYINSQLKDHQKMIDLFQNEINNGSHQSVKNYATKYLPHIQMHYNKADSISVHVLQD